MAPHTYKHAQKIDLIPTVGMHSAVTGTYERLFPERLGCCPHFIYGLESATQQLMTTKCYLFPAIVLNDTMNSNHVTGIHGRDQTDQYAEMIEFLAELRGFKGPNQNTPVILTYMDTGRPINENIEARFKEVGATECINIGAPNNLILGVINSLEKYVRLHRVR